MNETEPIPKHGRSYTPEFKEEAVDLLRTSGRPLTQIARDLDISPHSLRRWRNRLLGSCGDPAGGAVGEPARGTAGAQQLWDENVRLRRELDHLKRQRDILKKAASILAHDPQLGMR